MITSQLYFREAVVEQDIADAARDLLVKVNAVLGVFKTKYPEAYMVVSSGYRSPAYNARVPGAAPASNHMKGKAIDIRDLDRKLAKFCVSNQALLAQHGLYCEDPRATPTWVHFQSVPPASKQRFYIPNADAAKKLAGKPLTVDSI